MPQLPPPKFHAPAPAPRSVLFRRLLCPVVLQPLQRPVQRVHVVRRCDGCRVVDSGCSGAPPCLCWPEQHSGPPSLVSADTADLPLAVSAVCCACKSGRCLDIAMLARACLPRPYAFRLVRHVNAAHVLGYTGLHSAYTGGRWSLAHPCCAAARAQMKSNLTQSRRRRCCVLSHSNCTNH